MYRTQTCGELRLSDAGKEVTLAGWVQRSRKMGGMTFVDLRDRYGITQLVFNEANDKALCDAANKLGREYCIQIKGTVSERQSKNPKMDTGDIEILVKELNVLSQSQTPPFTIEDNTDGGDDIRMKYRYLDLRRPAVRKNLELRHRMCILIRNFLDSQNFMEVETPILIGSTPEGARDFVVPSRMNPGQFYALPQSPQTLKQLLMVAGFDRYFQIAKCFRDEDLRADRQPEFTQIDCEMSFVDQDDVIDLFEEMARHLFKEIRGVELPKLEQMTWHEAMRRFGSDKPDLRFGMEFVELKDAFTGKGNFSVFDEALEEKNLQLVRYAREHQPIQYFKMKEKYGKLKIGVRDLEKMLTTTGGKADTHEGGQEFCKALELDGMELNGLVVPKCWEVDMDGVRHIEFLNGVPYAKSAFSALVYISRRMRNVDDEDVKLELAFYGDCRWRKIIVPRGDAMDKSKLVKYANQGLPVTSETSKEAVKYMEAFETSNKTAIPRHRSIERMGWVKNREFFPYHMESPAAYDGAGEESHRIIAAVAPHGDKDKWMEMAATLRTMQAARVMLAASFASVLLQPLQQRPFIFHLWANSRSGKTAVLKAAVSIYGDPNVLLRSYNSTAVGIERTAGTVRNIPLALDELQSLSLKYENLSRMMYMLGNGIGKMRGDRIGGTQKMQTWCNTILSTGEQPITVQNSMDGENTRIMELYASPIGDTDFARTVHQTAAENYGFAGKMFMDYLFREYELEKGTSRLRQAYTNFRDEFVSMYAMLYEKCTSIHLEFVAVLVFADFIASKAVFNAGEEACGAAWEMGFELLEALKKEQKADAVERASDTVKEWIASNQEHFEVKHLNEVAREPLLGRYEPGEKKTYILPNCLRKMLIDNGFSYEKSIRGFKDRGYVENRQENQRVGKSSVKVIIANIEQAYEYRKASEFF